MTQSSSPQKEAYRFSREVIYFHVDMVKLSKELASKYTIIRPFVSDKSNPLFGELGSLLVKADTLYGQFNGERVVLYQEEAKPFTKKDLELRELAFKLYGFPSRPYLKREPKFEIAS